MTIDKVFFGYMAAVGFLAGAILVAAPAVQNLPLKPYFWILLAVVLFDVVALLRGKNAPGTMLLMPARLLGFVIGIVLMVVVPTLAGSQVRFF